MYADSSDGPESLVRAWHPFGRQFAVTVGSATALLSLLGDTPVHIASLRGAVAYAAILALSWIGGHVAKRTWIAPEPDSEDPEGEEAERAAPPAA